MIFVHEDPEFADLLQIVSSDRGLAVPLVEKDYWVTHALWALHETGLEISFKGGTSLSKGFGLIRRFSEDLDLQIDAGRVEGLPEVSNWKSRNRGQVRKRQEFFEKLENVLEFPFCSTSIEGEDWRKEARGADYRVEYPGQFLEGLVPPFRPFVLLEIGRACVRPWVELTISSFVHDRLEAEGQLLDFHENRPRSVRCLHPMVTLIEKLESIARRYESGDPAEVVRHYEDAARIIENESRVPQLERSPRDLIDSLLEDGTIRQFPGAQDPAFTLADTERREALERAHEAIAPMFWGERLSLDQAADAIRGWLARVEGTG